MKNELQHHVLACIADHKISRDVALDNLLEAMVHVTLQVENHKPVSNEDRRQAYRALCYLVEAKLEGNIQKTWRREKFDRLSRV